MVVAWPARVLPVEQLAAVAVAAAVALGAFGPHAAAAAAGGRTAISPTPAALTQAPDDVLVPVPAPPPRPAPTPAPPPDRSRLFAQLPANPGVGVFIPLRPGLGLTRMAIPNTTPGYSPTITLTFDDCGDPANMGAIVDALERAHRRAYFFVTGQCRERYPWLVDQLAQAGHQVCNHTYSHPDLRRLSDAGIRAEIAAGVMAGCPYFRPPYGSWDGPGGRIARIAGEFGLTVLLWDVDSRDWADADPGAMVAAIRARGGVVLFHLHGRGTVEAVNALG